MEKNPPSDKNEVASKNDELLEEHFNISAAQHNANIQEARAFAAENLTTLRQLAEEEDQLRQATIEAKRLEEERSREDLKAVLSNVLSRPFNRAALIGNRESVIEAYCVEKGITREELTGNDMMVISDMPEWIAEHPDGKGGYGHSTAAGITTLKF